MAHQLRHHSLSLEKTSILIDKPWALIDDEFEMQKLIFKKNKELILSKNGQVQLGKWDYFPEAKSLLIDRNTDKILCNEAFIDNGVMILKLDGTKNRFFVLANENLVPDLNAERYLKEIRHQKLKIIEQKITNGRTIEIELSNEGFYFPTIGNLVTSDGIPVEDGKYHLDGKKKFYVISKGRIAKIFREINYINPDGLEITIHQQGYNHIFFGDYVFISGKPAENGVINLSKSRNLIVKNGIVVGIERISLFKRWFS